MAVHFQSVAGNQSAPAAGPVPHLSVFTERMLICSDPRAEDVFEEREVACLRLDFEYDGTLLSGSDDCPTFFVAEGTRTRVRARDLGAELGARRALEAMGAVDLECLEDYGAYPDSRADYLVCLDQDVHAVCAFSAHALPELQQRGWRIHVADGYPYRVIHAAQWFARVTAAQRGPVDWFALQIGIQTSSEQHDLLPVLIELLRNESGRRSLQRLAERAGRCFAVPLDNGRYLACPPEQLARLLGIVAELYNGETIPADDLFWFPGTRATALPRLERHLAHARGKLTWKGPETLRDWSRQLAPVENAKLARADQLDAPLHATLRPYQEQGVRWLQNLRMCDVGGILADDMGLGKTLQTIAHLALEKSQGRMDRPSLVIAPTSLVRVWEKECARFAPSLAALVLHGANRSAHFSELHGADVVITSYPLALRDLEALASISFHFIVLDEAQTIKNPSSQVHRAVCSLQSRYRLALTGTPIENHLGEVWAQFQFLNPGMLSEATAFKRWYQDPVERGGDQERLKALQQRLSPYILRRLKSEVAKELPPKTHLLHPIELEGKQRELYEAIRVAGHTSVRKAIREKGLAASTVSVLDALMKLRQVCCDPRLVPVPAARFVRESAKYQLLLNLVDRQRQQGHRMLIFSQFTSMLALIAQGLTSQGTDYVALTGNTRNRQAVVDRYQQGDVPVMLISLKAGGTGLTLTRADTVIHYDPWWNPAVQDQATDRAYRIGQKRPVFVYNLFVAGSVEERMLELQQSKRHLATSILQPHAAQAPFTESELQSLFAPLASPEKQA